MTAAVKTLSSSPMTVKVFGVTPNRASGCMSCMTRCLTRCCMCLLNIYLLYHTLYLEERCGSTKNNMNRLCCIESIHLLSLTTMTEELIQRMGDNRQSSLFVNQVDTPFHAQTRGNTLLDKESQQMALLGTHFFAHNVVKTIVSSCPQISRT